MGDSITVGYNGKYNTATPYPEQVKNILGAKAVNSQYAVSGTMMGGTSINDFMQEMARLSTNTELLSTNNIITVEYGINDLNYSSKSLVSLQQTMLATINGLLDKKPDAKIYGILPLAAFKLGTLDTLGQGGYSENDLLDAEAAIYTSFNIPYLDWRDDPIVTDDNYQTTLAADHVHPTDATYAVISQRVAKFIENHPMITVQLHKSTFVPLNHVHLGWQHDVNNGNEYYYNGQDKNDIKYGSKYTGILMTVKGAYYFSPVTGAQLKNQLVTDPTTGDIYLLDNDGLAKSGLQTVAGATYYFDSKTYCAVRNQIVETDQGTFFFGDQGKQQAGGLYTLDNKLYYMGNDFKNVRNTYLNTTKGWLLFGADGAAVSGVQKWAGSYYYFDPVTHLKQTNAVLQSSWGDWYGFGNDGRAVTGVQKIGNTYYDFESGTYRMIRNSYARSQWGDMYLFGNDGKIATGVQKWAGTYYYFDDNTYLRRDNGYLRSQWGDMYLFGNDGRIQTDVQKWAGTYYYFDHNTYLRRDNAYLKSNWGSYYLFGNDGRIQTGVQKWAGTYYYFDDNTYLRRDNAYLRSQWGDMYLFGASGRIVSGWANWAGSLYYFDPQTFMALYFILLIDCSKW
ncbi:GDSL-type esterase/lipase family protein [Loigolactobacillus jiayinensis]|uniref:GDSL-type esterase/lipase family protein n=1 Tax=Loigolactobacillus jiayinensis TaxID=2486016 RepID=A0ABW1RDM0_9LACO|nr:GDSL-type esterase/lipase family protein [Loigolactobacillus jiayinensis]